MTTHAKEIYLVNGQVLRERDISFMQGFLIVSNDEDTPVWYNINQIAEMRGVAPNKSRIGLC